jgi:hypothetical protein
LGDVVYEDTFVEDLGWDLGSDTIGASSIQGERLVLTLRQPHSLRFAILPLFTPNDFYLEVDLQAELCKTGDEFGVMFRLNASLENYRFSARCEGSVLLSRILEGETRVLFPALETFALLPGPLANNQLALNVVGDTFRFWINSIEIFSISDPLLKRGELALFVRSGNSSLVTISFDNLQVRRSVAIPSMTITPNGNSNVSPAATGSP